MVLVLSKNIVYLVVSFILLALAILSITITYLVYARKKLSLEELEKEELYHKLKKLEQDLSSHQKKLTEKQQEGITNKELKNEIKKLEQNLSFYQKGLTKTQEDALDNDSNNLRKLIRRKILTDNDWDEFKNIFDNIHSDYNLKLKDSFNNITPSEIRILVLARLQLSFKEMSTVLGISPNSPRVTWSRFKKKQEIDPKLKIKEFAKNL